ncbi:MAG TPA: type II toxin-antitoxin system RelE/ParE family toxin [Patescibacteria group bacterium]|nr:type II toxin-antitoxin system RelE/ParE family toxin [Patescibacteria group bacterium]
MKYKLLLTKKGKDELSVLEKEEQKRIVEKLRFYLSSDNPLNYAKKLKDTRLGTYRFRIGDYRAIFDIDKQGNITILLILRIKHRKDVYL